MSKPLRPQEPSCPQCLLYVPGHQLHSVQMRLMGERRTQWRQVVVVARDEQELTLEDADGGRVVVWHHAPIDGHVVPGTVVHHHEINVLVLPSGAAICVGTRSGAWVTTGATFTGVMAGVVNLATGDGIVNPARE